MWKEWEENGEQQQQIKRLLIENIVRKKGGKKRQKKTMPVSTANLTPHVRWAKWNTTYANLRELKSWRFCATTLEKLSIHQ